MSPWEIYDNRYQITIIISKAVSCYGSENWIVNKRRAQKLEVIQMTFLRPLLGLTKLDRQRNPGIRNRLKVDKLLEDIKMYQKNWLDHLKRTGRNSLPKLAFQ
jgi:hypothetical protein